MVVLDRGKYHLREQLANGRKQLTIGSTPIHYRDDQGDWQPINLDWTDSGIGLRPNAVTNAPLPVSVADDGLRRIHPTRDLNKYVEIGAPYIKPAATWQKVNLGAPERSGNLLTWTTANANGYIWHAGHYVKLGILLKGGWTPPNNQFAFPVGINGLTRTGGIIYDNGVPVMLLDKPVVYDLDNEQDRRDIAFSFTSVTIGGQSQPILLMTLPDLTGMSRPLVDPTLTLQPDATAGVDAYINAGAATSNFGTSTLLAVGDDDSAPGTTYRTLIKFDLSSLPSSAVITSATLSLYATLDRSSNARTFRVYRVKRAWTEAGATWNKYDGSSNWTTAGCNDTTNDREGTDIGSRAFTATESLNVFKDFALTPTSKSALDLGNGWIVIADTESDDGYIFASSDHATAANRPKLVIIYSDVIAPSGIASTLAFGTPTINQVVAPSGIASTAAFGTPTINQVVAPSGIASTLAFGTITLAQTVTPGGIASTLAFGTPSVVQVVAPSGIASTLAFGTITLAQTVTPGGIASTLAFGTPSVVQVVAPSGIASTLAFGTLTLVRPTIAARLTLIRNDTVVMRLLMQENGQPMKRKPDIGDQPELRVLIQHPTTGAAVDPDEVVFKIEAPDGTETSYTYGDDDEVIRSDTGDYYMRVSIDAALTWTWRVEITGGYKGAEEQEFEVNTSVFS